MNILNEDCAQVIKLAERSALKKGHTSISTAFLLDGCLRLFSLHPEKYQNFYSSIKNVFGKYSINSKIFMEALDNVYAPGEPLPINTTTEFSDDSLATYNNICIAAQGEKRQVSVEDLMAEIFSNKSYQLYIVFSVAADIMQKKYDEACEASVPQDQLPPTGFDVNLFYADMQALLSRVTVKEIKSLESEEMSKYLTNLNKYVASNNDKLIGMEKELTALEVALAGRTKKSACIVGEPGTGKTALVLGLARKINEGNVPTLLKNTVIYELHMDAVVAGSQFRGQFEQRLKNILDAVSKLKNVILFIDEFHTMIKAGGSGSDSGGESTGANIMKPYLSRGDIWVIGATTNAEFNEYVAKDKAIVRRFKNVNVHEPTKEETIEIMRGILPINAEYFSKEMREEILEKVYDMSTQYNLETYNPDKALTMVESAFAYAAICRENNKEVTVDDMMHAIALQYDIDITERKAFETRKFAKEFLLGQEKAIDSVCKYLDMIELNVVDPEKPKASLMFIGPSGVGKTELTKIIAKKFTGSDRNLITVEGSALQSETGVSTLFGADAGYIGYQKTSDFLAKVKQTPNCVVLFDEIEKAHPKVFKSLLSMLDEGYVKDKGGDKISFKNAIIIFTSNLGYGTNNHTGSGMMSVKASEGSARSEVNKFFSPEFLGRIDEVIMFNRLDNSIAAKLIERYREKYAKLSGLDVEFTKADITRIKKLADVSTFGARNLDHVVKVEFAKKASAALTKKETV